MSLVQLIVQKDAFARDLSALLAREGGFEVVRAAEPDFDREGEIVADQSALERHPALLDHPERLIPITPNDPKLLKILWEHNIRSVVFESDPPAMAVLAILGSEIGKGEASPLVVLNSTPRRCANLR